MIRRRRCFADTPPPLRHYLFLPADISLLRFARSLFASMPLRCCCFAAFRFDAADARRDIFADVFATDIFS